MYMSTLSSLIFIEIVDNSWKIQKINHKLSSVLLAASHYNDHEANAIIPIQALKPSDLILEEYVQLLKRW